MAAPLIADIPKDVVLSGDYIIRITALSPTDGSVVSGVTISDVVITAIDVQGGGIVQIDESPNPYLVPSDDTAPAPTPVPAPDTQPPAPTVSGQLHTLAAAVTNTAQHAFAGAVADKLEPTGTPKTTLPAGAQPLHTLAQAITDTTVFQWAFAVANILEP